MDQVPEPVGAACGFPGYERLHGFGMKTQGLEKAHGFLIRAFNLELSLVSRIFVSY